MSEFQRISITQALEKMSQGQAVVADIRDEQSFHSGHIEGSYHLTNGTLNGFLQQTDFATPVIVVCYHGNSSQGAAQYLTQQGFDEVYSMDGGFEGWRHTHPFVQGEE